MSLFVALAGVSVIAMAWQVGLADKLHDAFRVAVAPSSWEAMSIDSDGVVTKTIYNPVGYLPIVSLTLLALGATILLAFLAWATAARSGLIGAPSRVKLAGTSAKLDKELAAITVLLRTYLEQNAAYSTAMRNAGKSLSTLTKPEQLRSVIKLLIEENERMQRDAGELRGALEVSMSQVAVLRSNLDEAEAKGMLDALTGVNNRGSFDKKFGEEVAAAKEQAANLSLVMADIDHFKRVNDTFGHLVGDEILKMFAKLLADNVKGRDTVARFGGEEFALILPHTDGSGAANLAERIRAQFESKNLVVNKSGAKLGRMTASFGVAELREGDDPERFLQRADAKLYEAKCAGRNRVARPSR